MDSEHCRAEMERAIQRHRAENARVIPIIVRPVYLLSSMPLTRLQMLPTGRRSVTTWQNRDEAWEDVAKGIHRTVEEVMKKRRDNTTGKEMHENPSRPIVVKRPTLIEMTKIYLPILMIIVVRKILELISRHS